METPSELETLCAQMQPCAQELMLDLARKYAKRWPAQAPSSRLALVPNLVKPTLHDVDHVIDGTLAVFVGKAINGQ